jgi:predicted DCC family thiol-disulfide oxidoreductase YuxK
MTGVDGTASDQPTLFYNGRCPSCQKLSRLAVRLSLDTIRRVPLDAAEAAQFYSRYPRYAGQILLIDGARITAGLRVFGALPRTVLSHWLRNIPAFRRRDRASAGLRNGLRKAR